MYASKVVSALAVIGIASAASATTSSISSQCTQATNTIAAQADADALSSCSSLTGDVVVSTSYFGDLSLSGIEQIGGGLQAKGAVNLTSISGSSLNAISGELDLESLTLLSTLSFPSIETIGSIIMSTVPRLEQLVFTEGVTECSSITITDTGLQSVDDIMNLKTVGAVNINNNAGLHSISPLVTNITDLFQISANGQNMSLSFPNLLAAESFEFHNVTTISMPKLSTVSSNFLFNDNFFDTISTPNLTKITGLLSIVGNAALTNVTMDSLTQVGGLTIANNTDLLIVDGFPKLEKITAGLDVTGNFTDVELPALADVAGAFNMVSSGNITAACNMINSHKAAGTLNIPAKVTCTPTSTDVQSGNGTSGGSSSSGSSSSSSSSGSSKKSAAPGQLGAPSVLACGFTALGLVGGFLMMLM